MALEIFILGILFGRLFPIFMELVGLGVTTVANRQALSATKIQKKIEEIGLSGQEQQSCIGFKVNDYTSDYDDEEEQEEEE